MRWPLHSCFIAFVFLVTACGGAQEAGDAKLVVEPQQFVLLPCGPVAGDAPCTLASIGGKRILFGAPAGVTSAMSLEDLKLLDAVMLFSLRASDTNGLAEVRNRSWEAGRDAPLLVVGPNGVDALVAGLNQAYEMADALRIVEDGIPAGGYDAALMRTRSGAQDSRVFNTGDVVVEHSSAVYLIEYLETTRVWLSSCKGEVLGGADYIILCNPEAGADVWPLQGPVFVKE